MDIANIDMISLWSIMRLFEKQSRENINELIEYLWIYYNKRYYSGT